MKITTMLPVLCIINPFFTHSMHLLVPRQANHMHVVANTVKKSAYQSRFYTDGINKQDKKILYGNIIATAASLVGGMFHPILLLPIIPQAAALYTIQKENSWKQKQIQVPQYIKDLMLYADTRKKSINKQLEQIDNAGDQLQTLRSIDQQQFIRAGLEYELKNHNTQINQLELAIQKTKQDISQSLVPFFNNYKDVKISTCITHSEKHLTDLYKMLNLDYSALVVSSPLIFIPAVNYFVILKNLQSLTLPAAFLDVVLLILMCNNSDMPLSMTCAAFNMGTACAYSLRIKKHTDELGCRIDTCKRLIALLKIKQNSQ